MSILKAIEKALAERELSAAEASRRAVGHPNLIRDMKKGHQPGIDRVEKLADVLDMQLELTPKGHGYFGKKPSQLLKSKTTLQSIEQVLSAALKEVSSNVMNTLQNISVEGFNRATLRLSIEAVEDGLEKTDREMSAKDKAELIVAVYDLLDDDVSVETIRKKYFTAA